MAQKVVNSYNRAMTHSGFFARGRRAKKLGGFEGAKPAFRMGLPLAPTPATAIESR